MNSINYRRHFPLTLFALAIFSGSALAFQIPLPKGVDKIELLSVDYGNGYIERIKETRTIAGKGVEAVIRIWKKQRLLGESPSACHQPAYALKFYAKGKLVMFATICWSCRDIDFVVPKFKHWVRFQADSRNGQMLKNLFLQTFPKADNVISRATEDELGADSHRARRLW